MVPGRAVTTRRVYRKKSIFSAGLPCDLVRFCPGCWFFIPVLLVLFTGSLCGFAVEFPKVAIPDLRTARELSGAVLSNRPPCDIVGVITYSNPEVGTGFIHDGTGEVFMSSGTNGPLPIKVGNRVRVTGVFENGWFTPIINDATVDVLGVGKLPGPEVLDYEQLFDGEGDARWLRLKAHVLDVQIGDAEAFLNLGCPMGRFSAVLPISALDDQLVRVGAELHLTGVLGTLFDINN